MISIGDRVPDYEIEAYHNNEEKKLRLTDYKGKWLVLVFYPADFTFICPTELRDIAEHYDQFVKNGAEVLSASTDTVYVHKAWHDSSESIAKIKFPMLADPAGRLCRDFGTYIDGEGLSLRGSFVIDPDGIVRALEVHDNSIGRSAKELLRKVNAAKFVYENPGHVCPASWEPGREALKPSMELVGKI